MHSKLKYTSFYLRTIHSLIKPKALVILIRYANNILIKAGSSMLGWVIANREFFDASAFLQENQRCKIFSALSHEILQAATCPYWLTE